MGMIVLEAMVDVLGLVMCLFAFVYAVRVFRKAGRKSVPRSFAECLDKSGGNTDDQLVAAFDSESSLYAGAPDSREERGMDRLDAFGGDSADERPDAGPAMAGGWTEKKMRAARLAAGGLEEDEIASKLGVSPVAVGLMLHAGMGERRHGGYGERLAVRV
jgi:hypothetical protein